MVTKQVAASVQNDGNFSQIDQLNQRTNVRKRIEVFRSSQPQGRYGITIAGTPVEAIAGDEHLIEGSNRIHRSIYSEGQNSERLTAIFELREEMNPRGLPEGSWDMRFRDLDATSPTYGQTVHAILMPAEDGFEITYELRRPDVEAVTITSPLDEPVHEQTDLMDIGATSEALGPFDEQVDASTTVKATADTSPSQLEESVAQFRRLQEIDTYKTWFNNVKSFQRFGDLGPKSVHPGTNLIGENSDLVAEYLVWRKYRVVMVSLGLPFDRSMVGATEDIDGPLTSRFDAKPGVYSIYVMANTLDIGVYKLVLDKVYSDYGGVPMEFQPGSRIETGNEPVLDATPAIETIAGIAEKYYLRPAPE